jgi:choline dehydrogenase-like flavoprotein
VFLDARRSDSGERIDCDVCIVGAGPAGITLARELDGGTLDVCLLESGGAEPDPNTQDLYAGKSIGLRPSAYLRNSRLRYFGGSTNHWEGMCAPLDPIDFERREWVAHSGWPISREALDPFYAAAQELCQLGDYDYRVQTWRGDVSDVPAFSSGRMVTRVWQLSPPTRFGPRYRGELARSERVRVYEHANAVGLRANETATAIEGIDVATLSGRRLFVTARAYVLAAGGIENARLLLASDQVASGGLGNDRDLVGRYFADHVETSLAASAQFRDPASLSGWAPQSRAGTRYHTNVGPSRSVQAGEELLNGSFALISSSGMMPHVDPAISALSNAMGEGVASAGTSAMLHARMEQAPNPSSRVSLGETRDALGMRRVVLDWRVGEQDVASLRRTLTIFAEELGATGQGRARIAAWIADEGSRLGDTEIHGGQHHMGTTRLGDDPAQSVVDPQARVHGIANLFVAGSSLFPTVGWANPTLTILALALRLSAHLRALL